MSRQEELIDLSRKGKRTGGKRAAPSGRSGGKRKDASSSPKGGGGGDFQFMRKQVERRARVRRNRLILLGCAVLLILLVFAANIALTLGGAVNTFYEGVTIDGLRLKGYDKQEAVETLRQLSQERLNAATLRFRFEGQEWTIAPELIGAYYDIEEQVELAWQQGREGGIFQRLARIGQLRRGDYAAQTTLCYSQDALVTALYNIKAQIDLPAQDAQVDFDPTREEKFRIQEEMQGREVIFDGLFEHVVGLLESGRGGVVEVVPLPVEPRVLRSDLQDVTERIRRVTTPLGESKPERVHNIKLALTKFNGMVVMPGQEISFNQITGPRGLEQGYQNAGVILDDEVVDGPGGGVCQVSTTLYQAVARSGLQIVRRSKHSLPVSYVPLGTDAAVAYDYLDLVFRNNYDTPVFLQCEVSGSNVSVTVYGKPLEAGVEIKIVSETLQTITAPEPEIIPDTDARFVTYTDETHVLKKSRDGFKVKTYAVWYKDGVEFKREQLSNDYYVEVKGQTYVGITPRPAQTPTVPVIGVGD